MCSEICGKKDSRVAYVRIVFASSLFHCNYDTSQWRKKKESERVNQSSDIGYINIDKHVGFKSCKR